MGLLLNTYYFVTKIVKGRKINHGKKLHIRSKGTILNGKRISVGNNFTLSENFVLAFYKDCCKDGSTNCGLYIGNNFSGNRNIKIYCAKKITIGDDVMFGSDILVTDNNHGMNPENGSYSLQELSCSEVTIGSGCWIGEKVCILSGVTIGEKAIIGAGSVVTKSIPSYSIACGNPAKVIKKWNFDKKIWERV